jgi:hypothetical protein
MCARHELGAPDALVRGEAPQGLDTERIRSARADEGVRRSTQIAARSNLGVEGSLHLPAASRRVPC